MLLTEVYCMISTKATIYIFHLGSRESVFWLRGGIVFGVTSRVMYIDYNTRWHIGIGLWRGRMADR
jgi:hypothetical protein